MINPGASEHTAPSLRVLNEDQIYEIRRGAFDIMQQTGFKVLHDGARQMLKKAGAWVREETVRVPEHIVQECLRTAPRGFTIFDRDGNRAMEVEGRKSYFGTSPASPNTKDARTGEIHETRIEDIAIGARVADACANIDWVMPFGSSQDTPSHAADLFEFEAVVTNTSKPVVFIGYTPQSLEMVYEMGAEVTGGMDRLREKPFMILYPEPISPLIQPADVVERIFIAADLCMPQIPGPAPHAGATGPVTLAGLVMQITAESLMCLVLAQLRNPGCPVCLSGNVQILDMATGVFGVGYPELSLGICAQAEVAQSFGLPTWGYAGCTDAKTIDAQAGLESGFSCLSQALSGLNLIHDVGYLDSGMVCSAAQLLLGNEAVGMTRRFLQGIRVNQDTLGRQVVQEVGPGGEFMTHEHTLKHFKTELSRSRLLVRDKREKWVQDGSKDMAQRIQEELHTILDTHHPRPLPDRTLAALQRIREKGESTL